MVENLVNLFTELSLETIKHSLAIESDEFESKKKNGSFNKYVRELRQKCLDIVIQSNSKRDYSDPCKTDYGAYWDPLNLILDCIGELASYGAVKASKRLTANVQTLQEKNYTCLQNMYKLIFLLRGSYIDLEEELQPAFLNTVSEYSLKSYYTTSNIHDIYSLANNNLLPSRALYKKYSTNLLESGCQLLTKLSNKNLALEKGNQKHLSVSTSRILGPSKSSDSSNFTLEQKSFRNNSFVQVANILYSSNHSLWDNFVEKPITSKLRRIRPNFKSSLSFKNSGGYGEQIENHYVKNEAEKAAILRKPDNYWTEVCDIEKVLNLECDDKENHKKQEIDLYPILKENKLKLENYESCFDRKVKPVDKHFRQKIRNSFFQSSETVILALWEQELKFRSTYNPSMTSSIPEMRILELEQFLRDVQFLLIGIGTDTFKYDEEKFTFTMKEGTCLEGVTPNTLLMFSKDYLEIGACYIKLSHHTSLNLKKQIISASKNCRIIFKVFWMCVFEYLCRHSQYVLKIPLNIGLLEFKSYVKNLYPVITAITQVCKINENDDSLPQGGQLLSYILQATQKMNNRYAAGVLFGILKPCCETYLAQLLQEWMFQGHIDRHHGDFFVEHRPKNLRCKDRSYYLSFFKFEDRIPSFLKGLENNIFNCGKTIHLLKLIQPDSKLCRLLETRMYPKIKLCLSQGELKEQKIIFERYAENIVQVCGQFTSIASLKQEEITRELNYEKYIMQVKKEQEREREQIKKESIEMIRRKREEQNHWLNKQIQLAAEEKRKKREQEEKESDLFISQVRQIAERERRIIEEEKQNIKMFYEELIEETDEKMEALTWNQRSMHLNNKNSRLGDCKSDYDIFLGPTKPTTKKVPQFSLLDDDKIVDHEGNIINCEIYYSKPELDIVNSNVDSMENQLEDIKNENFMVSNDTNIQFQKLIDSRKEYESRIESETVETNKENEKICPIIDSDVSKLFENVAKKTLRSVKSKDQERKSETSKSPAKKTRMTEAQKNKNRMMNCELGIGGIGDQMKNPVNKNPSPDSEATKNKMKIMALEYGHQINDETSENVEAEQKTKAKTEAKKNKEKILLSEYDITLKDEKEEKSIKNSIRFETEAEKNKKKIMASEYGLPLQPESDKGANEKITVVETEAQKNKRKILGAEFGESKSIDTNERFKKSCSEEALKNKMKIMASEFALTLEPESDKEAKEKLTVVETEAEKNKRKILGTEFGEIKTVDNNEKLKKSYSEEALKNKRQLLEIEYGYSKESILKIETNESDKELKISNDEKDSASEYLTEEEKLDQYINSELLIKSSSLAEKSLEIFNKKGLTKNDQRFFTLKENISEDNLSDDVVLLNSSEAQVLFEQNLRKPLNSLDLTEIATDFTKMDTTTFMNYLRQSLLIPLQIQEAIANEALFNHLLKKEDMLSHFKALRNYYFLNDGEFSRRLTQNMFATLAKCREPQQFFKRSTMNQIVYEALNCTIHSSEPYTQNVSFEIVFMPTFLSHASHDVLSPFDLSYQVKWPLNIIITEKALSKYKLVFHFLLKLKRINWTLNENFSYLTYSCKDKHIISRLLINSPHYHKIHIYRHAMGQFMRTLENYTSSCSLQYSWLNFEKDLESVKNLDQLYEKHVRYIKEVMKRCFLTKESHELLTCINSLIEISLKFHYATKSGRWVLIDGVYEHTKFEVLKATFIEYCSLTKEFLRTLRKKINNYHDLKPHEVLMEKFNMILR